MNDKNLDLNSLKNEKLVAMLAPSFAVMFDYPEIILKLRKIGFDKVVELTFGAKLVNHEYHKILKKDKNLKISTVCPGVAETVKNKYPKYVKNLIKVDSPMTATAKICKRVYPNHKTVFISPCNFKKTEARNSDYVDYVIDYMELAKLVSNISVKGKDNFDMFYNEYTKVYPLSGGLSKTAHLKGIIKPGEEICIDGIVNIIKFLENPDPKVRFMDVTFCVGGCIGGPFVNSNLDIEGRKKRILDYTKKSSALDIPKESKGILEVAKGIKFKARY